MDKYEYLWMCVRNNMLPGDISGCSSQVLLESEILKQENGENQFIGAYKYEEIFSMGKLEMIDRLPITKKQAEYIMSTRRNVDIDREYERFIQSGIKAVTLRDANYPKRLRCIDNPPYALFYYGNLPDEDKKSVAIIGARECSDYGRIMAETIASGLAKENVNIISGMAYGIDGISQMEALNAGGKSYAVIGSGVDVCYPRANKPIYDRLKYDGGVISEYPIGTPAQSKNFPMRNRIISGLSDVIVVVEAKLRSGTFITVDHALSQGKEIMVVPGRATDPLSIGCNALLYQGAYPAQSSDDVMRLLDTINTDYSSTRKDEITFRTKELEKYTPKAKDQIFLDKDEKVVYDVLDYYPKDVEEIVAVTGRDLFDVLNILINLEMKDAIREKGKNMYVKCG